jgi:type II secretory pathway component PulM
MKEKIDKILIISVIMLVILVVVFYWFAWRPSYIRKSCIKNAQQEISNMDNGDFNVDKFVAERTGGGYLQESIDRIYSNCLREHGLEK